MKKLSSWNDLLPPFGILSLIPKFYTFLKASLSQLDSRGTAELVN